MRKPGKRTMSIPGFLLGAAVAVVALVGWRLPGGTGTLGADVTISTGPIGELSIRSGPFVRGEALRPGRGAHGSVPVRNHTGVTLAVQIRVLPSSTDLDRILMIEVRAGSRTLYSGDLGGLREWSPRTLRLASGATSGVQVKAWLPAGTKSGYEARIEDITLEFRAPPAGG